MAQGNMSNTQIASVMVRHAIDSAKFSARDDADFAAIVPVLKAAKSQADLREIALENEIFRRLQKAGTYNDQLKEIVASVIAKF